ncbi:MULTISPECIES: erythromycin esterase family protein [Niastella]|uniref:Erythromycin esterase family protein n=1 Tax=Niastella soli TaxID=2821487 RepID=A0ABS3YND8_9BACT|nr:erythromycin esterase family protein [Niastella soli]MBO9199403.1 erythromycin esterase family protein [Niastella soli]
MKKPRIITVITVLLSLLQTAYSQDIIKQYVQEHAQPIASIHPDSTDYSDLEVIGKAIGDARVVMLGEQDHGDAPTFQAKSRLIKYLHEQKGFDVLAWESDFFGLNYGWDKLRKENGNLDSFLTKNINSLWSYCDACVPLIYQYIPSTMKTAHPLEMSGFDNMAWQAPLWTAIDSMLKTLQAPITAQKEYATDIYPLISNSLKYLTDSVKFGKCINYFKEIKQQLINAGSNEFWTLQIDNQLTLINDLRLLKDHYWEAMNLRDSMMAVNLNWLTEVKYAGKKIIVWAHNYHVSKYSGHYPDTFINPGKTMGTWYTSNDAICNRTYIIGFTSYSGTAGRLSEKHYKLDKPKPNSVENWINKDYQFAFLNFSDYNRITNQKPETFYMSGATKGSAYHKSQLAEWSNIYDGVFYIKDMYPCKEKK